jgi:hypothetical protein
MSWRPLPSPTKARTDFAGRGFLNPTDEPDRREGSVSEEHASSEEAQQRATPVPNVEFGFAPFPAVRRARRGTADGSAPPTSSPPSETPDDAGRDPDRDTEAG